MKKMTQRMAAAIALALGASVANAGTTTAQFNSNNAASINHLGSFNGSMSYDTVSHILKIMVTNTTSKGWLTGMSFNVHGNASTKYIDGDIKSTKKDEDAFDDARNEKGLVKNLPFGIYEAGTGLDGKLTGKKKAKRGIAAGASHEFSFLLNGTDASSLSAVDFLTDPSGKSLVMSFGGLSKKKKKTDKVVGLLVASQSADNTIGDNTPSNDTPSNNGSSNNTSGGDTSSSSNGSNLSVFDNGSTNGSNTNTNTGGSGDVTLQSVIQPGGLGDGIIPNIQGGDGNGPEGAVAIPLPPAAYSGLATMGLLSIGGLRRKLRGLFA